MPNYIIAYRGGTKPESPEAGADQMAKWKVWIGGLGDAVVNPGTPLGKSKLVSSAGVSDDAGSSALTGFSIVKADDMDAALEMARACPFLDCGGERRLTTRRRGHSGASKKKAALGRPAFGTGNEIRTHDFNLGKVALYR